MKFWIHINYTPLYYAVKKRNLKIVHLLLNHQNIDCNTKSFKELIKRRVHYDVKERHEKTPLHLAAKKGYKHPKTDVNITSLSVYDRLQVHGTTHVYYISYHLFEFNFIYIILNTI